MFRGFFFAVLLQVRGLWKRASWKPAMCFTWKPIVEWSLNHWNLWYISILRSHQGTGFIKPWLLLGYLQLCYLSFGMKGCKCCETGCGFTHSTWPLKYRKQESVTPPCSVPGRLHYPAKICVVFAGLPNCHGICSAKKLLLPSGLQIKLCLSHCKKHAPNPKRACMRISFGAWQGRPYCLVTSQLLDLQIQRCYHFNTPNFWFTDPKMPKIYKDCRMHQESCSSIIGLSHCNCIYFAQQKLELWLFRPLPLHVLRSELYVHVKVRLRRIFCRWCGLWDKYNLPWPLGSHSYPSSNLKQRCRQFGVHEILNNRSNNLDFQAAQCQNLIFAKKLKSSGSVFRLTASFRMKLQSSRSALR